MTCQRTSTAGPSRPPASSGRSSMPRGRAGRTRSRPGSGGLGTVAVTAYSSCGGYGGGARSAGHRRAGRAMTLYNRRRGGARPHPVGRTPTRRPTRRCPTSVEGCRSVACPFPVVMTRSRRPGENLGSEEARERAAILSVERYDVALDVRSRSEPGPPGGERTFRSTTVIDFRCATAGRVVLRRTRRVQVRLRAAERQGAGPRRSTTVSGSRSTASTRATPWWSTRGARTAARARACTASSTRRTARHTSTPSTRRPRRGGCSRASSSRT